MTTTLGRRPGDRQTLSCHPVSRNGHPRPGDDDPAPFASPPPPPPAPAAVVVGDFQLAGGQWFERHRHDAHQLVWAHDGVVSVRVGRHTWLLPTTLALWVPAGVAHATGATTAATLRSPYLVPSRCPIRWPEPTVVAVGPLLRGLVNYLNTDLGEPERVRAEAVAFDLLRPVSTVAVQVAIPTDPRARRVAEALVADPGDNRTLEQWGHTVGASVRTLSRTFVAETGLPFGRWRGQARLRASLPALAAGAPVATAARRAGFASPSAFTAAFRRHVGVSPSDYFAGLPDEAHPHRPNTPTAQD